MTASPPDQVSGEPEDRSAPLPPVKTHELRACPSCGAENRAQWEEARSRMWDGVALRALGPVALAWLLAYGFVQFARRHRG